MTLWLDRLFTAGLLFLIVLTPFAYGTVEPWGYTAMEVIIFALVIVWMLKRAVLARQQGAWSQEQGISKSAIRNPQFEILALALPLALFLALCALQLVPLPPSVLKVISPQTFEVYKQSLPGWPERVPYAELESMEQGAGGRDQGIDFELSDFTSGSGEETRNPQSESPDAQSPIQNPKSKIENSEAPSNSELQDPSSMLPALRSLLPPTWLPLSISVGLTKIDLLKFIAFAALFFLVWRYPLEEPFDGFSFGNPNPDFFILSPEQRFLRSVVFAVLGTGLFVAAFGFVGRFAWNGNLLLLITGYESGVPAANTVARASGPFINPDHFANYLSLIFPLALGCALFRTFMVPRSQQHALKICCGFTVFLIFTGILLSLSRGAWISTLLGIAIFAWLSPWQGAGSRERSRSRRSEVRSQRSAQSSILKARSSKLPRVARLSAITACILLTVSLFVVGSGGREQVDLRLTETFEQSDLGLGARVDVILKDVPKMIMDFPLFGVGLGAWTELFPRYRSGPWSTVFFREAHNDYLEVLAETGLIGLGLLTVFFFVAGKRLVRGLRKSSSRYLPLIAGILSALGGMALHEWFDFNLQIPAIAFLFTVLLAIGLRFARQARDQKSEITDQLSAVGDHRFAIRNPESAITAEWAEVRDQRSDVREQRSASKLSRFPAFQPAMGVAAAVGMIVFAVTQDQPPYVGAVADVGMIIFAQNQPSYPHNFTEMSSLVEAKELLLKHPTHSPYHMSVLRLAGGGAPLEWQLTQAKAALWNEPANPYYRDFYAATLMAMGETDEGLKEVTRSVTESPSLSTHVYLNPENLPLLSEAEQDAVEEGFKQALSRSYPEALNGLADFYAKLERFSDQGALYEQAALKESDKQRKLTLLMNAGGAYLKAAASSEQRTAHEGQSAKGTEQSAAVSRHQSAVAKRKNATVRDVRDEGLGVRRDVGSKEQSAKGEAKNAERSSAINAINATNGERFREAAERAFRAAIAATPTDPKPYQQLITAIYTVRKDLDGTRELVADGIKSGAPALPLYLSFAEAAHKSGNRDESSAALESAKSEVDKLIKNGENPYTLYIAFADGARSAGDREEETAALLKALDLQPRSPDVLSRLAGVYFERQNFDRAALYLNRIAQIKTDSADVYFNLAVAEEGRYRFADAGRAYARAIELAPKNTSYRERYEAFKARVDQNRMTGDGRLGLTARTDGRRETGDR